MKRSVPPAFLDTSFVVRYLTNDPPAVAELAAAVIDSEERLILSEIVLLESAYVLTSVYGVPRAEVVRRCRRWCSDRTWPWPTW
jgi:predicted nucleic acid-binding protein